MTMRLYQPMLFVGLGGTGGHVGAELERRLRDEICGPDGADFQRLRERSQSAAMRYQLPACVQFVYADVNQADLDRLPQRTAPGPEHEPAVRATAHYVRNLVPSVDTYPEVAASLRLSAGDVVRPWLPPETGEPRVAPLQRGAGQLPTVGRAALFETFRQGLAPAIADLSRAIGNLANSAEDLNYLGGTWTGAVDVFVAFSVAGGTGAGIFYDYLHLIGKVFEDSVNLKPQIYPLVLMPSAFGDGVGGGRPAQLNAGRALLDLYRLVDDQNGGDVDRDLKGLNLDGNARIDPDEVAVRYPLGERIRMRPATTQTAFLFSLPVGAQRDDLHRSMVSLMISLVGSELDQNSQRASADGQTQQSFADSFINGGADRQVSAANGIGARGVSTALVASMTIPDDELADLIAGRLLRHAVLELAAPLPRQEQNRGLIERFFGAAGIGDILTRPAVGFTEPDGVNGAKEITAALGDRAKQMQDALAERDQRLTREMPRIVADFDPRRSIDEQLGAVDVFRMHRVVSGSPRLSSEVDRLGAEGMMSLRVSEPARPGLTNVPPALPELHDRFLVKVKWADAEPVEARQLQDTWFRWRTASIWSRYWKDFRPRWSVAIRNASEALRGIKDELWKQAQEDPERFRARAEGLARTRVGVSYLLPPGGDLDQFYARVKQSMIDDRAAQGELPPSAREADLVNAIIGAAGWRRAYDSTREQSAAQIVASLRTEVKAAVKQFFRTPPPNRPPLIAPLSDRLAAAAGVPGSNLLLPADVQEFKAKLAGLVPGAFDPQGNGPIKILVSYPANSPNRQIEDYLKKQVNLPAGTDEPEFRPTTAETIAVVLFRSRMGVTEVREVREVLRTWATAQHREQPKDYLRWRQRTGFGFSYLATSEEHRVRILHHMLNAIWNGKAQITGDLKSPTDVSIVLGGGMRMTLPLTPFEQASSWASLLRGYELWTLDDDKLRNAFCEQLMSELPNGLSSRVTPPSQIYHTLADLAESQPGVLAGMRDRMPVTSQSRLDLALLFWEQTFPAAKSFQFEGVSAPIRYTLADLEESVEWQPTQDELR